MTEVKNTVLLILFLLCIALILNNIRKEQEKRELMEKILIMDEMLGDYESQLSAQLEELIQLQQTDNIVK